MSEKNVPGPAAWASDETMTFYMYLQRRYRAGEEGGRLAMDQVVDMLTALEAFEKPVPRGGSEQKSVEAACAVLYMDPAQFFPPEEGDAGEV